MPITKHSFFVKNVEDLAPTIRRAFRIAKSGRPGPVLVDITKDVTAAETEYTYEEPAVIERKTDTIREEDINKVIEMIFAFGANLEAFPITRSEKRAPTTITR